MGKDHLTGPLINEVAEPPAIPEVLVLVIDIKFEDELRIPFVSVKVFPTVTGEFRRTPPFVLLMVRL